MQVKKIFTLSLISMLAFLACNKKDDGGPEIPNEEELITTVIYTLQPISGADPLEIRYTDLDGDGSNAPIIQADSIPAQTDFVATVQFLNEAAVPAEDITEEIEEEDLEHQLFYAVRDTLNYSVVYADEDIEGNPVGLTTTVSSGKAGMGTLTIILRHEPIKNAIGVSDGDFTNAGGETDIEVELPLHIYE